MRVAFVLLCSLLANGAYSVGAEHEIHKRADREYMRPCYFTNWAQYRPGRGKYMPEDYIPGLCTHILYAFGWMNEDFTVKAYDPADLPNDWAGEGMFARVNKLKQRQPGLKTLLSFGGWTFGTRLFKLMSPTAAGRKVFIDSAINFVRQYDFDGIDIDWEYPQGEEESQHFTALINEMRVACEAEASASKKERLLLSAAVSAGEATLTKAYDIPTLANPFDFINIMSYDFWGAWNGETGMNAPLYARAGLPDAEKNWNVDWAAKYWVEHGMPKEKINIGVATYGRGWTLKDPNNIELGSLGNTPARKTQYVREDGVASYYEFCEMLNSGAKKYWQKEHQVPYLVDGDQFWSYDDVESTKIKMDYVKKNGYGGAFVWTLDFDDFNAKCSNSDGTPYPLISVIAKELSGVHIPAVNVTTKAPITTTKIVTTTTATATKGTTTTPKVDQACSSKADGFYAKDGSCYTFVLCLKKVSYPMTCPVGLSFSKTLRYCVQSADSGCSAPVVTTTTAVPQRPTTTTASGGFKCVVDGFQPDPKDCSGFYRCVNGTPYHFQCPGGLNFNPTLNECDNSPCTPPKEVQKPVAVKDPKASCD